MPTDVVLPERYSKLARFIVHRLNENRDLKLIITGKGAATGIGKTTLAIRFADYIHSIQKCENCGSFTYRSVDKCHVCNHTDLSRQQDPWDPDQSAFIDPWEYMDYYLNSAGTGEFLLQDESQYSIHKRRAVSGENVEMTKVWSALRYRNCVSCLTLPSTSMIDSMMMQLGDIWINVVEKGTGHIFKYWFNDFKQSVSTIEMHNELGMKEKISFSDLSNDSRKKTLDKMKKSFTQEGSQVYDDEELRQNIEESKKVQQIRIGEKLLDRTELNQTEIGRLIHPKRGEKRSQQYVSKLNRGRLSEQDEDSDKFPIRG